MRTRTSQLPESYDDVEVDNITIIINFIKLTQALNVIIIMIMSR